MNNSNDTIWNRTSDLPRQKETYLAISQTVARSDYFSVENREQNIVLCALLLYELEDFLR